MQTVYDTLTGLGRIAAGHSLCPALDNRTVAWLEAFIPVPRVVPGRPSDTIMFEAGARSVVDALRMQLTLQERLAVDPEIK
jgi:hypothetical protein